jgi:hypothetical protein
MTPARGLVREEPTTQANGFRNQIDIRGQMEGLVDALGEVLNQREGLQGQFRLMAKFFQDVNRAAAPGMDATTGKELAGRDAGGTARADARLTLVAS